MSDLEYFRLFFLKEDLIFSLVIPFILTLLAFSKMTLKEMENVMALSIGIIIFHCLFCMRPDQFGLRVWPMYLAIIPGLYYMRKISAIQEAYAICWIGLLGVDFYHCMFNKYFSEGQSQIKSLSGIGGAGINDGLFLGPIFVSFIILIIPLARHIGLKAELFAKRHGFSFDL